MPMQLSVANLTQNQLVGSLPEAWSNCTLVSHCQDLLVCHQTHTCHAGKALLEAGALDLLGSGVRLQNSEVATNVATDILPLMGSGCHTGLQMSQCSCANPATVATAEVFDNVREQAVWESAKLLGRFYPGKSCCQNALQCSIPKYNCLDPQLLSSFHML